MTISVAETTILGSDLHDFPTGAQVPKWSGSISPPIAAFGAKASIPSIKTAARRNMPVHPNRFPYPASVRQGS
ncbi:MAG: hypothetical protein OEL53_14080 [Rhodospirillales bacterium]|nr:hypothetical protein [Rhodospirillales bacterium]